jgi:ribosome recycling factor
VANVFDPSLVKAVATAIAEAELQLNPQVLGSSVKMAVPRVTKEYRDTLAKRVTDAGEEAKVALRKHRHEVLGAARKAKDALSKDDMFRLEEELTKQTKAAEKAVSEQIDRKTKEVLKE